MALGDQANASSASKTTTNIQVHTESLFDIKVYRTNHMPLHPRGTPRPSTNLGTSMLTSPPPNSNPPHLKLVYPLFILQQNATFLDNRHPFRRLKRYARRLRSPRPQNSHLRSSAACELGDCGAVSGQFSPILSPLSFLFLTIRLCPSQLVHSAVLTFTAVVAPQNTLAMGLFTAGMTMFSGSIYLLVLDPQRFKFLGPVTPLGGLCLIGGWVALAARGRPVVPKFK
jgi:uncharacterized membrane protein YgdD (TMEM256/DUF423 family)